MDIERMRGYFDEASTIEHYARAVAKVGLWESEKLLARRNFAREERLLDLGCGAGRVAIGLWELGYVEVLGADLAPAMVARAKEIAKRLGCPWRFEPQDATRLSYADESFDGVIFAFNGLMQIPGSANRQKALGEVFRVLRPGGRFLFSTLDREDALYSRVFADSGDYHHDLSRNPYLLDYGDRHFATEHGTTFMHVPTRVEMLQALESIGFELLEDAMRSDLAQESAVTLDFSEDCRLWVARKS